MIWLLMILLLLLIWAALRFLPAGSEGRMPLPYVIALIPFLWIPALVCAVVAGMFGEWVGFGVALLETALLACVHLPYWRRRFSFDWLKSRFGFNSAPPHGETLESHGGVLESSRNSSSGKNNNSGNSERGESTGSVDSVKSIGSAGSAESVDSNDSTHSTFARFTVMTLNCRYGRASAEAIIVAVRTHCIAVLALQELTRDLVDDLEANGLSLLLPYRQLGEDKLSDNGGFNGVWTRFEPVESQVSAVDIPAADVPSLTVAFPQPVPAYEFDDDGDTANEYDAATNDAPSEVDNADPTGVTEASLFGVADTDPYEKGTVVVSFASAHTKSPMRGCRQWAQGIIGLKQLAQPPQDATSNLNTDSTIASDVASDVASNATSDAATSIRYASVVLGDLNAALDHPSFRLLLASGFSDANLTVAQGVEPTFPAWLPWPRITLDHVLCTQHVTPIHIESFMVDGTDHLALTATLVVHP